MKGNEMTVRAIDLVANLLAEENLTVVRVPSKTASFNIKTRVLSLPIWKDLTPEMEDLFVIHEVGHALYTGEQYLVEANDMPGLHSYMNVVEDARIEKLMKRKFPGVRKVMNTAYTQLNNKDFFGIKDRDLSTCLLVDKINIHFKVGYSSGVKFTPEENRFVVRAERAETIEQVIQLSKEILEFSKQKLKEEKEEKQRAKAKEDEEDGEVEVEVEDFEPQPSYGEPEYDDDFPDEEEDEDFGSDDSVSTGGADEEDNKEEEVIEEQELESITDKALQDKLEEFADDSIQYRYYSVISEAGNDPIVGYKQIFQDTKEFDSHITEDHKADFGKFMQNSTTMVNYLVKEFEMKKSADQYKRATTSKLGSLDMKKLHAYKFVDDIFKQITVVPGGKNHGMIFLLDWSGSMSSVMRPTLEQLINLVMFCRRINIPYEVYAFTSSYGRRDYGSPEYMEYASKNNDKIKELRSMDEYTLYAHPGRYNLLELFTNKMSASAFNSMARRLLAPGFFQQRGYAMGGTPLNEALVYMMDYIPKFNKKNLIQKTTFITLTDGEGCNLDSPENKSVSESVYYEKIDKRYKVKNFIQDQKTGKQYELTLYNETKVLLQMIKDRTDAMIVGFFICQNKIRCIESAYKNHYNTYMGTLGISVGSVREEFKEKGFASMRNTGRDELFLIPESSTRITEGKFDIDSDMTASSISKKFGKMFNTKKHSRILLDRFISMVA
jgi:hypothetical protein